MSTSTVAVEQPIQENQQLTLEQEIALYIKPDMRHKDWVELSKTKTKLSNEFLTKYADKIEWDHIILNQPQLDEKIIENEIINSIKCRDNRFICTIWLYKFHTFSEKFLRKYANTKHRRLGDVINWISISRHQKLSENFIEEFADKVDWKYVSEHQRLSDKFIEKHVDKIVWSYIVKNPNVSDIIKCEAVLRGLI